MPWYVPYVPETIKKKVCVYLLQRYLGQFFEEKLTVDQLTVDLYNGTGTVTNVSLDVQVSCSVVYCFPGDCQRLIFTNGTCLFIILFSY